MENSQRLHVKPRALALAIISIMLLGAPTHSLANAPTPAIRKSQISAEQSDFQKMLLLVVTDHNAAFNEARALSNDIERRIVQWAAIYYGDGAIPAMDVRRFHGDAPSYLAPSIVQKRIEQFISKTPNAGHDVIGLLGSGVPNTIDGKIALADAFIATGQNSKAKTLIANLWVGQFMDASYEARILEKFALLLSQENHWRRAVHLLMHDRARGAERLIPYLTPAQKTLVIARAAVARKSPDANALLNTVDRSLTNDPLFHFSNAQYARRAGRLADAVKHLNRVVGTPIDSAEFWYERRLISRRALAANDISTAYAAAAGYLEGPEGRVVDAQFHAGWIAFQFMDDAPTAANHFKKMIAQSTLPDSVTRAHYWFGKSLQALNQTEDARAAFSVAAKFRLLYYGQLARHELGISTVDLQATPAWRGDVAQFENRELVKAIRLLAANGRPKMAEALLRRLMLPLKAPGDFVLSARLAQSVGAHNIAILIADIGEKRGVSIDLFNFPKDGLPANAVHKKIDKSAVYAVARQESKFDVDAVSRSGARGLMQLMPGTAQEVAGKVGLPYSSNRLVSDPSYNVALGSTYLSAQLDRFDGSLVLAAAAYNAGGGNVNKWIKIFGDPRTEKVDPVSWIEAIPFLETRKYTQRVIGNFMVYRARFGDETLTIREVLRRIKH